MVAEQFSDVVFDFEEELPLDSDPALDARTQELMKKDRRFKTVVCRHWVKGLCMKLDNCEFLHELNTERMPECRWGEKCQVPDCTFKHTKEQDRLECSYYGLGFCMHGSGCRYRHVRKAPEECPDVVSWDELPSTSTTSVRRVTEPNENFKISLCRHFMTTGNCPFGDKCHFAHGEAELRKAAPRKRPEPPAAAAPFVPRGPPPLDQAVKSLQSSSDVVKDPMADSGSDLQTPDRNIPERPGMPLGPVRYFVLRSKAFDHVAASVKHSLWSVHPHLLDRLNEAFFNSKQVMFVFTVNESKEFVGCAKMVGPVERFDAHPNVECPPEARGTSFVCKVEWTRTCVLPYGKSAMLQSNVQELGRQLPVAFTFEGTELSPEAGHALIVMLYREPAVEISPDQIDPALKLAVHMPGPAPEMIPLLQQNDEHMRLVHQHRKANPQSNTVRTEDQAAGAADEEGGEKALIAPGSIPIHEEGFVFAVDDQRYVDQMFGIMVLATTEDKMEALRVVKAGTYLVLLNLKDGLLFGVFQATGPAQVLLRPTAFLGPPDPKTGEPKCALPAQVPIRVALNVPPFNRVQVPPHIMKQGRDAAFIGIDAAKMQQLVNLFAIKAGLPAKQAVVNFSPNIPPGVTVQPVQVGPNGQHTQKITINIPFKPQFKAAHRLIGKGGANMKRIQQESNVSCRVRGVNDAGNDREINGAMDLIIVTKTPEDLPKAIDVGKEIIDDIIRQHEDYVMRGEQMRNQRLGGGRGRGMGMDMKPMGMDPRGMEMGRERGRGRGRGRGPGMHPGRGGGRGGDRDRDRGRGRGRDMERPGPGPDRGRDLGPGSGQGHGPGPGRGLPGRFDDRPPPDFQPFDMPPFPPPDMRGRHPDAHRGGGRDRDRDRMDRPPEGPDRDGHRREDYRDDRGRRRRSRSGRRRSRSKGRRESRRSRSPRRQRSRSGGRRRSRSPKHRRRQESPPRRRRR